ncbi:Protein of unknown function [Anaplasma phagocytophilum]|uniref:Uncharacterized protein n=1 Tax=Anaplasma phagocytophilum TaxID=948 RepID=A0A098GJ39_ANAPH|nr:Protein of unknown function [Anaplasma phagocytophilum]
MLKLSNGDSRLRWWFRSSVVERLTLNQCVACSNHAGTT